MLSSLHLKTLFWLAVVSWAVILFFNGQTLTTSLLNPSSIVLGIIITAVTIFEKWLWRFSLLYPWFVGVPNLIGVYKGELNPYSIDPSTNAKREVIPAFLVIRQTFSTIYVRVYTADSESCSILGSFIQSPDGTHELLYTYRNEPRLYVRPKSPIHYGGARLTVSHRIEQLEGSYWNDRQSIGDMKFLRINRDAIHSFQEGEELIKGLEAKKSQTTT